MKAWENKSATQFIEQLKQGAIKSQDLVEHFIAKIEGCLNPVNPLQDGENIPAITRAQEIDENFLSSDIEAELDLLVYPNIIHQEAAVKIGVPTTQAIEIALFNQQAQKVATLITSQTQTAGNHYFRLDASQSESGFYVLRLAGEKGVISKKIIVAR